MKLVVLSTWKLQEDSAAPSNVSLTVPIALPPILVYSAHSASISPTLRLVILIIQLLLHALRVCKVKIVLLAKISQIQLFVFNVVGDFSLQQISLLVFLKYAMFPIAKSVPRMVSSVMAFKYALCANKATHWTLTYSAYHWAQH